MEFLEKNSANTNRIPNINGFLILLTVPKVLFAEQFTVRDLIGLVKKGEPIFRRYQSADTT